MPSKNKNVTTDYLLNTLNDLKTEIKGLRAEMNRVEETVLKERLRVVEEALSQSHLMVYAGQRSENINEEIAQLLKSDCQNKEKCLERCKAIVEENTKVIKESGSKNAISDLDAKIAENELMVEKTKGHTCEACFANFHKKLKREKRAYQEIVLVEDINKHEGNEALDIPFLIETLLEPLASYARLKILASVYEGKKSFSELSRIVDLKAGHLAFHLKKLVAAKLITQEASKGDYVITQRGLRLIKKMLFLQTEEEHPKLMNK